MPKILCVVLMLLLMSSAWADEEKRIISAIPESVDMAVRIDLNHLREDPERYGDLADQVMAKTQSNVAMYLGNTAEEFLAKSTVIEYSEHYLDPSHQAMLPTFAFHDAFHPPELDQYISKNGLAHFSEHTAVPIYFGKLGQAEYPETFLAFQEKDDDTVFMIAPTLATIRMMIETVTGSRSSLMSKRYGDKLKHNDQEDPWFLYYYDLPHNFPNEIGFSKFYPISNDFHQHLFDYAAEAYPIREFRGSLSTLSEIDVFCHKLADQNQLSLSLSFPKEEIAQTVFGGIEFSRVKLVNHYRFQPENQNNPTHLDLIDMFDHAEGVLDQTRVNYSLNLKINSVTELYEWKEVTSKKMGIEQQVGRAKADMRTLATAIESYKIDSNQAPAATSDPTMALAVRDQTISNTDDNMSYFMKYDSAKRAPMTITTPIAYVSSIYADPFSEEGTRPFAYFTNGRDWILQSAGPDGDSDISGHSLMELPREKWEAELKLLTYDASNGIASSGDIWRINDR